MRKHATEIRGFEGRGKELAVEIHRMRYDQVARFYRDTAEELVRQAKGDRGRNRPKLAALLDEAAESAVKLQKQFEQIWELCAPHMKDE